nr:uncharacterized protein LOC129426100 [Misgurnus anguillicaudatus]
MHVLYCIFISALLKIADGFTVKGSSGPLVVPLGGSVVLPCSVDSILPLEDLEVDWKRSDTETLIHLYQDGDIRPEAQHQDYHDRAHFFTEDIKHGNFSLLLNNLTAEDEGQYTCKVYSGQESGESVVEVQCGERLIVSGSNHSISAYEGEDVTLSCSVDSHIKPEEIEEVSWKKRDKDEDVPVLLYQDNMALPEASDKQFIDRVEFFNDEIHRGNFSLRLKRVRTEDKGVYICQVFARGLSANTTGILEQLGFSTLHIMVLILCIAACGSAVIICSCIYCRSDKNDTSRCVQACKVSLVICPNIFMFIAFIIWGVTEGFLKESITCSALYILRPVMLFWTVPHLDDLQDRTKPWIRFLTITGEFAALSVIFYSVIFTYTWKQISHYIKSNEPGIFVGSFAFMVLFCLCIFPGVQALVLSRLDYCNALLVKLQACTTKPLQMIQNAVGRVVFNEPKRAHLTPLFVRLQWLPIAAYIKFKALLMALKTTTGSAPHYLQSLIQTYVPSRSLRSAALASSVTCWLLVASDKSVC